jgi:hypothetical protein
MAAPNEPQWLSRRKEMEKRRRFLACPVLGRRNNGTSVSARSATSPRGAVGSSDWGRPLDSFRQRFHNYVEGLGPPSPVCGGHLVDQKETLYG